MKGIERESYVKVVVTSVVLLLLILFVIGFTYAAFQYTKAGERNNHVSTTRVSMSYIEDTNGIMIRDAMPEEDATGRVTTDEDKLFQFTVDIKTVNVPVTFEVTAEKDEESTLTNNDVRLYLERSSDGVNYSSVMEPKRYKPLGEADELGAQSNEMRLDWGTVSSDTTYQYILRMWVSKDYVVSGDSKYFTVKVNVYGKDGTIKLVTSATEKITSLVSSNTSTMFTDNYGNVRYMGASPNNYVTFNGENAGWRIVGVFGNNIKLVRDQSIGSYLWDTSDSSVNTGWGVNDWSKSDLMKLLNEGYSSESVGGSLYWNRGSGTCYIGMSNAIGECDFRSTGLKSDAKNMIETMTWNLGGWNTSEVTVSKMYGYERGTTVWGSRSGQNCNDGACPRVTTWTGKVGLLYPSDFGYASSACKSSNVALDKYYIHHCENSDWLSKNDSYWLLSQSTTGPNHVFYFASLGMVGYRAVTNEFEVYPTFYLKSSVAITGGSGTSSDPYEVE